MKISHVICLHIGADKVAKIHDIGTGNTLKVIEGESVAGLNDCSWLEGNILVTAADDGFVRIYDLDKVSYRLNFSLN